MSVKTLNEGFRSFKLGLNRQEKTVSEYLKSIEKFESYIKSELKLTLMLEKHLTDVTFKIAQNYIKHLKTNVGLSHNSVKKELVALQEFYKYFQYEGMVELNPFNQVSIPKDSIVHEKKFMKLEEGDELISAVESIGDKTAISLMVKLGLRIEEVCNVEVENINLEKSSMTILRKGNKMHTLPIPTSLKEVLTVQVEQSKSRGHKYLFQSPVKKDSPVTTMAIRKVFDKAVDKLGKEGKQYHPHSCRGLFGQNLRANGFELEEVQKLMNHSSHNTTMKYYLTSEETKVANKMANM